jgi:adenine-specific DNA-methyltransferase
MNTIKDDLIAEIDKRVADKILEPTNAELLKKLIRQADNDNEAMSIAELGTTYKRTGLHFDKRLELMTNDICYFKKNEALSFHTDDGKPVHKLIIGDNYQALQNLLIQYKGKVDVIYIDPPYGKDSMGEFAQTNYENAITRDNLLSMLYPRLMLAKMLLSESGVIFCSIDDRNQAYVKCLFDEVFGESGFLFNVARITKKGGKTTDTIQKNNDYVLAYALNSSIVFSRKEKDLTSYELEDEFVNERGKYKVTQTLDYGGLSYSKSLDYSIVLEGRTFYPGGSKKAWEERQKGNHKKSDWIWRWKESAFKWGLENGLIVLKGDRLYTKTYSNCRKKNGLNELEFIEAEKPYTTLSFLENEFSNDNAKKELDRIFVNGEDLFKNPKPSVLIEDIVKMVCSNPDAIILDFFAGSGTTGHAVLDLNKDGGDRTFILCQLNETAPTTPNGIAYDVTAKRLKRIMTGECYDGTKDFKWINENKPYGGNLDVYDLATVANFADTDGKTPFEVIDETLYGLEKFQTLREKVEWVCGNFSNAQKNVENDDEWKKRIAEG